MTDIPELTDDLLARAIPGRLRKRLMQGRFDSGADIAALRTFVGMTQAEFAQAIGISVHTLRNWEQGRRKPEGPAVALRVEPCALPQRRSRLAGSTDASGSANIQVDGIGNFHPGVGRAAHSWTGTSSRRRARR
jgi:DNA-binding XRE family transcriptional regulator